MDQIPTPSLVIDAAIVRRNIARMAQYAAAHNLKVHPHTKTHKSRLVAGLQLQAGAAGITVAKPGEAAIMAELGGEILLAYPVVDAVKAHLVAELAHRCTLRVGVDSGAAADALAHAAQRTGSTLGILVDIDAGMHRTGVQTPAESLRLAQHVSRQRGLRLDGVMFYPGHLMGTVDEKTAALKAIDAMLEEAIDLWRRSGLEAGIVSGSSTPTAAQSHLVTRQTHIRAGTYVYHDRNSIACGYGTLEDCAARYVCTVVSTAVPGQAVIDAGTKTLTSDRCAAPGAEGFGLVVEYPDARITRLTEEHGQVNITACPRAPRLGERVTVVPNHVCPSVNLHDSAWWLEPGEQPRLIPIDARGRVH